MVNGQSLSGSMASSSTRYARCGIGLLVLLMPLLVQAQQVGQPGQLHDAQWLIRQSNQAFTLQLVTLSSRQQVERSAAGEPGLKDYPIAHYRYQKQGRLLYVMTLGVFADAVAAQQVKESLQLQLVAPKDAWIRPLDEIQAQIRTTLQL